MSGTTDCPTARMTDIRSFFAKPKMAAITPAQLKQDKKKQEEEQLVEGIECDMCGDECSDNYAGCCNDGDCKFGHEKLCWNCAKVIDEDTGVPTCLKCLEQDSAK